MSSPQNAGWLSTLGRGGKWLAGIVVVAVVGALVSILVPRLFGPAELGAELSRVSIQAGMTLEEYAVRQRDSRSADGERTAAVGDGGVTLMVAAAAEPAQARDQTREAIPEAGAGAGAGARERLEEAGTTTTPTTTTRATTTPTTTTPTTTTPTTTTRSGEGPVVTRELSPAAREAVSDGVADAIEATPQPLVITPGCRANPLAESCGLSSLASTMQLAGGGPGTIDTVSEEQVARELTRVFRGTRTVRSPDDPRKRELVGAAVDFNVALTGFRGKTVQVRWSLYSATQRVRVPRAWLRNQRIMLLRGEAERDSASAQFWVPIPQLRGPFFIRVGVYDGAGGRLDYADTEPFR